MRHFIIGLTAWAALTGAAAAHDLPACTAADFSNLPQASQDEIPTHGGPQSPHLSEPFGALQIFDFYVDYIVDETGHVTCLSPSNLDDTALTPTPERQVFLDTLAGSTFIPFTTEGRPTKVAAATYISEEERPPYHVLPPQGDLSTVEVRLENHGRRSGDGPFTMTVKGDGTVSFLPSPYDSGRIYGPQTYHIPADQVTAMLDLAEKADFWSLRDTYYSYIRPDEPLAGINLNIGPQAVYSRVAIRMGDRQKELRIYDWSYNTGGAPEAARHLMQALAQLARIDLWRGIRPESLSMLEQDGFDFKSPKGCDLLIQLARRENFPDDQIQRLLDDGVSPDCVTQDDQSMLSVDTTLLDTAVEGGRKDLVNKLIAQGALLTDGKMNSVKVTRALIHALAVASPDMVNKIMPYHPDRSFRHRVSLYPHGSKVVTDPIIIFVGRDLGPDISNDDNDLNNGDDDPTPDLIAVTQKLLDAGADINAWDFQGGNLLIHAMYNDQVKFARWLLNHGASPRHKDGSPAWIVTNDDDMTVFMLDAGAADDPRMLADIVTNAERNHEPAVEAWLKAHGKWPAN